MVYAMKELDLLVITDNETIAKFPRKPKHLFTVLIAGREEDNWYVSVDHFPGGFLAAQWEGLGFLQYKSNLYIPLPAVESETRRRYDNVRKSIQDALTSPDAAEMWRNSG